MIAINRDKLLINGKETPLIYSPEYLNPPNYSHRINLPLPENHPRIVIRANPRQREDAGYIATWEIKEDRGFYLVALQDDLFELQDGDPLLADWISGSIRLSDKQEIHIKHGKVINRSGGLVEWIQQYL